jgi:hypothetical protein
VVIYAGSTGRGWRIPRRSAGRTPWWTGAKPRDLEAKPEPVSTAQRTVLPRGESALGKFSRWLRERAAER